jgi:aspartate/methionine/tyrosine aminotransferase
VNPLFANQPLTIFEHMSASARAHGAANLGQGFPDFGWPDDVIAAAARALALGSNQYPPMRGLPELRDAVCAHYRAHQGVHCQPDQVTVTSGATEALAASLMALISPGDEVLLFEPLFDAYLPIVRQCGGVPRFARLEPPAWRLTPELIDAAFTPRTRVVVFTNPHNPAARVFDEGEMARLAEACIRHDAILVSDEVWEHLLLDGRRHVPIASLPGMAERTVKIGSGGKMFSMTGWKVGWALATDPLARAIGNAHQFLTFTTPPNLQSGVAFGLAKGPDFFDAMRARFEQARDFLVKGLEEVGLVTLSAEGSYFLCLDLAASGINLDDRAFCERAVQEAGVAAIPLSTFYADDPPKHLVRLCFAKRRETLEAGIRGLALAKSKFA